MRRGDVGLAWPVWSAGPAGRARRRQEERATVQPAVAKATGDAARGLAAALLSVPLYVKIIIANAVVVVTALAIGAAVGRAAAEGSATNGRLLLFVAAAAAVVLVVVVNAILVRIALRPIASLEATAARIAVGEHDARAETHGTADTGMVRLVATFNDALDSAAEGRQRLREVAARAITAAEDERRRIARELHDGTAQVLAGLRVQLRLARASEDADGRAAQLDDASRTLADAIEAVRHMAGALRPPALDMLGLRAAVEALARSVGESAGLEVVVESDRTPQRLETDLELTLYRILQEALANVVRHADARRVVIRLRIDEAAAELEVEDDGRGFTAEAALRGASSVGLFGMQERAAYLGGQVEIRSTPGQGTRIRASIPRVGAA